MNGAMTVGERIRARRKELGIEVEDLASKVGLAASTIYELENGRQKSTTKLHRFARELGVTVEYLETGRAFRVAEDSPAAASHFLRIDPETIAAAIKLVRLSFLNIGLEIDQEQNGLPLAYAYEFLMQRQEREVTAENVVAFRPLLERRLREQVHGEAGGSEAGGSRGSDREHGEGRKAS